MFGDSTRHFPQWNLTKAYPYGGAPTKSSEAASEALEFEVAARHRDRLSSVLRALEKQQMVAARDEDLDVFGLAGDDLEAAAQVFYVRRGRVVGRKGFVVERVEDLARGDLVAEVVSAHYRDDPPRGVPGVD